MTIIPPVSAAILQAASFTLDKKILSFKKVNYKTYLGISFPLTFLFTLIFFIIFKPSLSLELFKGQYLFFLSVLIILALFTNMIFYRALKSDLLSEMQTLDLLKSVPLILFAGVFFIDERNLLLVSLAIIASFSVIWSHWEKHHFKIAKKTLPFLVWTMLVAPFGGIIYKTLLEVWNPISLLLIVNGFLAVFFLPFFNKKIKSGLRGKPLIYLLLTNLLTTIAGILFYFSIQISGIVFTVLVFSLQPTLVYFTSLIILKEKFNWKKTLSFIIIIIAVTIGQIYR